MDSSLPELHEPEPWFESAARERFLQRLAHTPRLALLLDYDGTLAPFHADKMQAFPYPGVPELLASLYQSARVRLALVSGRRAQEIERLLPLASQLEVWGSHGREYLSVSHEYTLHPASSQQAALLESLFVELEHTLKHVPLQIDEVGSYIDAHGKDLPTEHTEPLEKKVASLAVHWRGLTAASQAMLRSAAEKAYLRCDPNLIEELPFASGVEFRATGYTKAFAVEQVLAESTPGNMIAYLGDDLTDEDAFVALGASGESLLVGTESRATHARHRLRPPAELIRFLEDLCVALHATR